MEKFSDSFVTSRDKETEKDEKLFVFGLKFSGSEDVNLAERGRDSDSDDLCMDCGEELFFDFPSRKDTFELKMIFEGSFLKLTD